MFRALAALLLAGAALTVPSASTAAHAAPATRLASHREPVSLEVHHPQPTLGDKIVVRGEVRPRYAPTIRGIARVLVRFEGKHHWRLLGTTRLDNHNRYQFKTNINTTRDRRYRVVVPRLPGHGPAFRTSAQRVRVYTWRNLTTLTPIAMDGLEEAPSFAIGSAAYPDSIVRTPDAPGHATITYNVANQCIKIHSQSFYHDESYILGASIDGLAVAFAGPLPVLAVRGHWDSGSLLEMFVNGGFDEKSLAVFETPQILCLADAVLP